MLIPKRLRRFSLLTLIIVSSVLCIWLGLVTRRAKQFAKATERWQEIGGRLVYDYQYNAKRGKEPVMPGPQWLRDIIGDEFFVDVITATFQSVEGVTNEDLKLVRHFPNLVRLDLDYSQIDDIAPVASLSKLEWLDLEETRVDDADLRWLNGLTKLRRLVLTRNAITDDGIANLRKLPELQELRLNQTAVTDHGIQALAEFSKLTTLELEKTQVTAEGVAELSKKLPRCRIVWDGNR